MMMTTHNKCEHCLGTFSPAYKPSAHEKFCENNTEWQRTDDEISEMWRWSTTGWDKADIYEFLTHSCCLIRYQAVELMPDEVEYIEILIDDPCPRVREELVSQQAEQLSSEHIEKLINDSNEFLRKELYKYASLTPELIATIAKTEKSVKALEALCLNRATPSEQIFRIASRYDRYHIDYAVLTQNPNCPPEIVDEFRQDEALKAEWAEQERLASIPKLPVDLSALMTEETMLTLVREGDDHLRLSFALNPTTPSVCLDVLGTSEEVAIRKATAGNPSTTPATLDLLSTDSVWSVREQVAMNKAAPTSALARLRDDSYAKVREAVRG